MQNLDYLTSLAMMRRFTPEQLRTMLLEVGLPLARKTEGPYILEGDAAKGRHRSSHCEGCESVLLDEPTSGLDPKASNEFSQLLVRLKEQGVAMLMATHDLFRAKETGTRLGIMRSGVLQQILRADEIGHTDLEGLYLDHMSN